MESAKMRYSENVTACFRPVHRLRTSGIHELYWRIAGKESIIPRDRQLDFYRRLLVELRPGDLFSTSAQTRVSNPICS